MLRSWSSPGMKLRVCVLDTDENELQPCVAVPRKDDPQKLVTINVPIHTHFIVSHKTIYESHQTFQSHQT